MAVRPLHADRDRGLRPHTRSVIIVLVAVLTVTALISLPIAAGTGVGAGSTGPADDGETGDINVTDSIDETDIIDETMPDDGTVEIIVRLEDPPIADTVPGADVEDKLESHAEQTQDPLLEYAADTPGITVDESFWLTNAVVLTVDTDTAALEPIAAFDAVERVHENFAVPTPDQPSATSAIGPETVDAQTATQTTWGIDFLNIPTVWEEYDTRGEGVRVAVLDTGVDADHPDIDLYTEDPSDPTYPGGWAEFDQQGDRVTGSTPYDSGTHGTHVSGTVAGGDATGVQIGVAPDVELLHGLVLSETSGSFAQVIAGMEWAVANDADVASMSLGTEGTFQAFVDPVANAHDSGTIIVGAIGNDGHETSSSPGNVYESISVGAVHTNGTVASFSGGERIDRADWHAPPASWPDSYTTPDVVAPGVSITSAFPDNRYARMPGTSMATPHVSGTIALMLSVEPDATPEEIETTLIETTWTPDDPALEDGVDPETRYGHGIVDASAAINTLDTGNRTVDSASEQDGSDPTPVGTVVLVAAIGLIATLVALVMGRVTDR